MASAKHRSLISGICLGFLLLWANPAKAQSATVHKLGVLNSSDSQLSDGSYFDIYEIAGSAGERVTISLDSSEFDTYLGLLDSEGNLLVSNDDAADNNPNSYISLTLPADGTYTVMATAFTPQAGGEYRLSMRNFNAPRATRQTAQSSLNPIMDAFALSIMGAAISEMFFGGGGGGYADTGSGYDPAMRNVGGSRPAPQPARPPMQSQWEFYN